MTVESFTTRCCNGIELHKRTYHDLQQEYRNLPVQLVCAARVKVTEAVKSALDRLKKGRKAGVPCSRVCPIRYGQRSYLVKCESFLKAEVPDVDRLMEYASVFLTAVVTKLMILCIAFSSIKFYNISYSLYAINSNLSQNSQTASGK